MFIGVSTHLTTKRQDTLLKKQLRLLKLAINNNTLLMGGLNLGWSKKDVVSY
jgi:hypothetical protein